MEFKKGDIVTAEFLVIDDSDKDDMRVARNSEWELVRQALDLSKPLRFQQSKNPILAAYHSVTQGYIIVEFGRPGQSIVAKYLECDLENIPEDEL